MSKFSVALKENLKQYSLMVAPVLASTGMVNGQIIYHDLEPDVLYKDAAIGDNYTEPHFFDLDNDGVVDLKFAVWSSVASKNGPNQVNLVAARQLGGNGNAIMGYTNIFSASICSTPLPLYCPSNLNEDEVIGPAPNFWAVQGSNSMGTLLRFFIDEAPPNNFVGQWNDQSDRFMGFRFMGGDGNMHYGWMRLDVTRLPASITFKEYGFESQNNVAIKAGDRGNVGIMESESLPSFDVFMDHHVLHIKVNSENTKGFRLTVTNVLGQLLTDQLLSNSHMQIPVPDAATGILLITLSNESASISKAIAN